MCKKITLCILEANFVIHLSNKGEFVDNIYPSDLHGQKFNATELSFYLYPFFAFCSLVSHLAVLSMTVRLMFAADYMLSHVQLCDPWIVAHQAPLSVGFSR